MITRSAWYALPVTILLALILGPILRDGMFLDGLVYTNIAKNLADGVGSFWEPLVFRKGIVFHEHPVLLPWLESLYFRLLGDGVHTEDWYNFTVLALTIWLLHGIWSEIVLPGRRWLFFFPLLLWVLNQEVQLRYPNAMLECGTTLIILATVRAYLALVRRGQTWVPYLLCGIGAMVAFYAKGPFGLFLLGIPFLHRVIVDRKWSVAALLLPVLAFAGGQCVLFLTIPASWAFVTQYFDQQLLAAVAGRRVENIADTRFDFLFWLIAMNVPALVIVAATAFVRKNSVNRNDSRRRRYAFFFLAAGATAIVPLVVSIKQAAYYQLPALPFFVLGLSLLFVPNVETVTRYVTERLVLRRVLFGIAVTGILAGSYVAISMFNTTDRRDRDVLALTEELSVVFREQDVVDYKLKLSGDIPSAANRSYRLTGFLARHYGIHANQTGTEPYLLMIRHGGDKMPEGAEVLWEGKSVLVLRLPGAAAGTKDR